MNKQPKTHSGKIVRHLLRRVASEDFKSSATIIEDPSKEAIKAMDYATELKEISMEEKMRELDIPPSYYAISY